MKAKIVFGGGSQDIAGQIYRFSAISIKIPASVFGKLTSWFKINIRCIELINANTILKNTVGDLTLQTSRLKTIAMKSVALAEGMSNRQSGWNKRGKT